MGCCGSKAKKDKKKAVVAPVKKQPVKKPTPAPPPTAAPPPKACPPPPPPPVPPPIALEEQQDLVREEALGEPDKVIQPYEHLAAPVKEKPKKEKKKRKGKKKNKVKEGEKDSDSSEDVQVVDRQGYDNFGKLVAEDPPLATNVAVEKTVDDAAKKSDKLVKEKETRDAKAKTKAKEEEDAEDNDDTVREEPDDNVKAVVTPSKRGLKMDDAEKQAHKVK